MAISLRRSRRATKKGVSDYNVGDIVEIDRQHGVIARGRLAQLLTEGPSPNPRWLVKFDSQPYKDEEMYERAFGKLLHSAEDGEDQHPALAAPETTSSGSARGKTSATAADFASDGKGTQGVSSEGDKSDDGKKGKNSSSNNIEAAVAATTSSRSRSVQSQRAGGNFSQDSADDSSPADEASRSRASAREARSRRRQAMIDDAAIVPGTEILAGKRKLPPPPGSRSKQYKTSETQYAEEGEVVKVKLLTGTLYLYRGEQRRVEFVRRV
eukprot:jgi/Psemu1/321562/estExt_fgenesh1_pg.C_50020